MVTVFSYTNMLSAFTLPLCSGSEWEAPLVEYCLGYKLSW